MMSILSCCLHDKNKYTFSEKRKHNLSLSSFNSKYFSWESLVTFFSIDTEEEKEEDGEKSNLDINIIFQNFLFPKKE